MGKRDNDPKNNDTAGRIITTVVGPNGPDRRGVDTNPRRDPTPYAPDPVRRADDRNVYVDPGNRLVRYQPPAQEYFRQPTDNQPGHDRHGRDVQLHVAYTDAGILLPPGEYDGDSTGRRRKPDEPLPPTPPTRPLDPPSQPVLKRKAVGSKLKLDVPRTKLPLSSAMPRELHNQKAGSRALGSEESITRRDARESPSRRPGRRDVVCKARPTDNTPRGGGGAKRGFIPWCR